MLETRFELGLGGAEGQVEGQVICFVFGSVVELEEGKDMTALLIPFRSYIEAFRALKLSVAFCNTRTHCTAHHIGQSLAVRPYVWKDG